MTHLDIRLAAHHQAALDRFVAACRNDERVVAAFLGGSNARGQADAYSDIDLCVITTDEAFDAFVADREAFVRQLGQVLFLEDFDLPRIAFAILSNGAEVELNFAREGALEQVHCGPFQVLLDERAILAGRVFPDDNVDELEQRETLRRLIAWFWHELSHFITAMGRGQLWWAYGQLEALRRHCVALARLRHDFSAWAGGDEPYFKVEHELPDQALAPLLSTCAPRERQAMLDAAHAIVAVFRELARPLAEAHVIGYPAALDGVMTKRLEALTP
jgi:predicted nucleotidyltransferase